MIRGRGSAVGWLTPSFSEPFSRRFLVTSSRRLVVSSSRRFGVSMGRGGGVVLAVKTRR